MRKLLALLCSFYFIGLIQGQTIHLVPDPGLTISDSTCYIFPVGTTLMFQRDPSCDPNILIASPLGLIEYLNTPELVAPYTFSEAGDYAVFCGANDASIAISAVCIIIEGKKVPSLSTWGAISLFLAVFILSVISIRDITHVIHT